MVGVRAGGKKRHGIAAVECCRTIAAASTVVWPLIVADRLEIAAKPSTAVEDDRLERDPRPHAWCVSSRAAFYRSGNGRINIGDRIRLQRAVNKSLTVVSPNRESASGAGIDRPIAD
jgi:hypothetical protein